MPITFDRSICRDLNETISREWLVTNGVGGYAAGTIAGVLTRMQHGLLVTSQKDAAGPQLLSAKIDEEVVFDERKYYLGTNEYRDGTLNPAGFGHLEAFRLEEGFPVFTYHLGGIDGIMLEKRIWMPHGFNTTYIQYRLLSTSDFRDATQQVGRTSWRRNSEELSSEEFVRNNGFPAYPEAAQRMLSLTLLPLSAYRPHSQPQYGNNDWHFQVQVHSNSQQQASGEQDDAGDDYGLPLPLPKGVIGCTIRAWDGATPYSIFAVGHPDSQLSFIPTGVWYWHFLRRHDQAAGRPAIDDLYLPGVIKAKLWPCKDSVLTIMVTAEELSSLSFDQHQLNLSYKRSKAEQKHLVSSVIQPLRYFGEGGETSHDAQMLSLPPASDTTLSSEEFLRLLIQAADRFLVQRALPSGDPVDKMSLFSHSQQSAPVILSDYFSLEVHTRDALIALPGLTLATKRFDEARRILRYYARYFKQGLLPDRLPSLERPLEKRDYGSADTTLWYFFALDHYLQTTHDYQILDELYHHLIESVNCYTQGTLNGIKVDPNDGLLRVDQPGNSLTWMRASIDGTPSAPRRGKPVEVNALWYNALSLMHQWTQHHEQSGYTSHEHEPSCYQVQATRCKEHFQERFWYAGGGYLYDVIDGQEGNDSSFRPHQLLALSLRYSPLDSERRRSVFELITEQLLTPFGLRTLAPKDQQVTNGKEHHQSGGQESILPWLIGPYTDAMLALQDSLPTKTTLQKASENWQQHDPWQRGLAILAAFRKQFNTGQLGMIDELYDVNSPQRGEKVASVLSVAELLRIYDLFVSEQTSHAINLLSSGAVTASGIPTMPAGAAGASFTDEVRRRYNRIK